MTSLLATMALIGAVALMGTLFVSDTLWVDPDEDRMLNAVLVALPVTIGIIGMIILAALAIARG